MGGRRERWEIILHGGKPWGFSIKGGSESNKPLVISKIEARGKAERGGLCIGDVIFSINNVRLSGIRSEAIKLVKTSGENMMLEIERGVLPSEHRRDHFSCQPSQQYPSYQVNYNYPTQENQRISCSNMKANQMEYSSSYYKDEDIRSDYRDFEQNFDKSAPEVIRQTNTERNEPSQPPLKDVASTYSYSSAGDANTSEALPSFGNTHGSESKVFASGRSMRTSPFHSASNESVDRNDCRTSLHGHVRMRRPGKSRDRNTERPSSWHASKHSETERSLISGSSSSPTSSIFEDRNMRSPGSTGCQSPQHRLQSTFYYHPNPHNQLRRKSKGWTESGDLKSTLKGEVNGSKDSLLSSSSRYSYRSNRLSVSSSRSSGNMSSSGSLDNLDSYHDVNCNNNIPEIVHRISPGNVPSSASHRKHSSPSQLQQGNVDSKKNIFEKLSHLSDSIQTGKENPQKISSKIAAPHFDQSAIPPWRKQYHEMSRSSVFSSSNEDVRSHAHNNNKNARRSLSPSSLLFDKENNTQLKSVERKLSGLESKQNESIDITKSYQHGSGGRPADFHNAPALKEHNYSELGDNETPLSSETALEHDVQYAAAKIVKTMYDPTRGTVTVKEVHSAGDNKSPNSVSGHIISHTNVHEYVQLPPPSPPSRDSSSMKAVIHFQEQQNVQDHFNADLLKDKQVPDFFDTSPTNGRVPVFPNDQTEHTSVLYPVHPIAPGIASPVTEDQKTNDSASRHGRMFGVMAYGADRKNVVAKTITISSPHLSPISSPILQRAKPEDKHINLRGVEAPYYEHLKDTYSYPDPDKEIRQTPPSGTDYVTRMMEKKSMLTNIHQDENPTSSEFPEKSYFNRSNVLFGENKARASGRYGEIWKTPQIHRRTRSSDANAIISTSAEETQHASEKGPVSEKMIKSPLSNLSPATNAHIHQSSFDAKSRRAIYQSSESGLTDGSDDITRKIDLHVIENENLMTAPPMKQDPDKNFTGSSIMQALQNSQKNVSSKTKFNFSPDRRTTPSRTSTGEVIETSLNRKKSSTLPANCSPSFKEVLLDEPEDDTFMSQNDEYRNHIKGMSKKVLRVTSFTRKDLELSPSFRTFDQRREVFEFSKLAATKEEEPKKQNIYLHGRSRSQGNELEEGGVPITSARSSTASKDSILSSGKSEDESGSSQGRRPRPKSAGAQRKNRNQSERNWHAPKLRQTVIPGNVQQFSIAEIKAGSLPRNMCMSLEMEKQRISPSHSLLRDNRLTGSQHSLGANFTSPEHRRVEVEVRPDFSLGESTRTTSTVTLTTNQSRTQDSKSSKLDARNAVLGFYKRKTGKTVNVQGLNSSRAKSTSNFFSQQTNSEDQQKKNSISSDDDEERNHRIRNVPARAKSTSSLLEEAELQLPVPNHTNKRSSDGQVQSDLSCVQRSSSLENLTADSITSPTGSSTSFLSFSKQSRDHQEAREPSPPRRNRTKSNDFKQGIQALSPGNSATAKINISEPSVQPPPRTRRQRFSHSSSASSATTVSTLSSYSSSSSTSIGASSYRNLQHPPPLDEQEDVEEEIADKESPTKLVSPSHKTHKTDDSTKNTDKEESTDRAPLPPAIVTKRNINTGTYKIAKGFRNNDPTIKIPVVYPEDNSSMDFPHDLPIQVPQRRRRISDQTSLTSTTSTSVSSSTESMSVITSPNKKSSVTEITLSNPSKDQLSSQIIIPSPSKSPVSVLSRLSKPEPLLPPPPPLPVTSLKCEEMRKKMRKMGKLPADPDDLPPPPIPPPKPDSSSVPPQKYSSEVVDGDIMTSPVMDIYREETYLLGTDSSSDSNPASKRNSQDVLLPDFNAPLIDHPKSLPYHASPALEMTSSTPYENVHLKSSSEKGNLNYVNVCVDVLRTSDKTEKAENTSDKNNLQIEKQTSSLISSKLSEDLAPSSLTNAIIKSDKTLAQVLSSSNKKTLDYMHGILTPSRNMEPDIRYRQRKPVPNHPTMEEEKPQTAEARSDPTATTTLPASSTYYQTSASKAKIMHLVQEKVEGGEIDDVEDVESEEEINRKKVELVSSISNKIAELQSVKDLIKIEMKENEELGKQVNTLAESVCTSREHEKFNTFVEEVDKIINLLLSLSARLARVENALATLPEDATSDERNSLLEKKEKLTLQHEDAKSLNENVEERQKAVSEILASYLNTDQFADYEHYIKMKTTLIMEQRELDDKMKLGEEQMQCLRDSLPDDWQRKLDEVLEEESKQKQKESSET